MNFDFNKIAVIGSGTMGSGIAVVLAKAGIYVNLNDIEEDLLYEGMSRINKFLEGSISRGKMTKDEADTIKSRIIPSKSLAEATRDIQLVIEAIIEESEAKRDLFMKLDEICKKDVIFASNTSAINITELASATKREEQFLGLHFFNPPVLMKLVEVIRGEKTDDVTFNRILSLCQRIEKTPVPSNESPGFIVNKLLWVFVNESFKLVEGSIAKKEDIDAAVKLGLNHPMGPFELSDYIGLDIMLDIGNYISKQQGEMYKPSSLLVKKVEEGKLGRKTGEGFYLYTS